MAVLTPRQSRLAKTVTLQASSSPPQSLRPMLTLGAFALYLTLLVIMVVRHEAWFDEAQGWLLARDAGPVEMFSRWLPNEGSPGLWHLILLAPAKLGMPYATVNWISAALAAAAAFMVLRFSPFPLPVKIALPFSFFLFYQYGVIARSYALLAPLLFAIALAFPRKYERPAPFFILLALLANVSAHGLLIAASIAAVHAFDLLWRRRAGEKKLMLKHLGGLALLGVVMGAVVLQLLASNNALFEHRKYELHAAHLKLTATHMLNASMLQKTALTAPVLLAGLWWFWRKKVLLYFLFPTSALFAFFSAVYWNAWHEGIPFLVWVFALWISLQATAPISRSHTGGQSRWGRLDGAARIVLLVGLFLVALVQIRWSSAAFRFDLQSPYSGSKAAAEYIKAKGIHKSALHGMGFPVIALQPYFAENIFDNYNGGRNPSFWDWSRPMPMAETPAQILQTRPDFVLLSVKMPGSAELASTLTGYKPIACFPGGLAWKTTPVEPDGYVLLEEGKASGAPIFVPKSAGLARIGCEAFTQPAPEQPDASAGNLRR